MPMGLTNAPFTFQIIVNKVLKDSNNKFTIAYLDDILVYSNSIEEHYEHLEHVLNRLTAIGLKLNISKSVFAQKEVQFLGFLVGHDMIRMTPKQIDKAVNFKTLENKKELRTFLGFINYLQRFIPNFSIKLEPLYKRLKKENKFELATVEENCFVLIKNDI